MWTIVESRDLGKTLCKLQPEIVKRYEKWKDVVRFSGVAGLREIKGFHDEALSGLWAGFRSSRLNAQYRVVYKAEKQLFRVYVIRVTAHDYRK